MRGREGIAARNMGTSPEGRRQKGEEWTVIEEGQDSFITFLLRCLAPLWGAECFLRKECHKSKWTYKDDFVKFSSSLRSFEDSEKIRLQNWQQSQEGM